MRNFVFKNDISDIYLINIVQDYLIPTLKMFSSLVIPHKYHILKNWLKTRNIHFFFLLNSVKRKIIFLRTLANTRLVSYSLILENLVLPYTLYFILYSIILHKLRFQYKNKYNHFFFFATHW